MNKETINHIGKWVIFALIVGTACALMLIGRTEAAGTAAFAAFWYYIFVM